MARPNPYAPPTADFDAAVPTNEHEATRRRLIGTETNIRSLGSLVIFGGALSVPLALGELKAAPSAALFLLVVGAVSIYAGLALRKLDVVGRIVFTVIAVLGILRSALFYVWVSTMPDPQPGLGAGVIGQIVVVGLFLALVWSRSAREVFTDHYRRVVIPATPYVKYKTSVLAIVVLVILVLAVLSAIAATLAR